MSFEILTSSHPGIVKMRYFGDLEAADIISNVSQLNIPAGKPFYMVVDAGGLNMGLPDFFLEAARKSIINHPDVMHMAVYVPQAWLRSIINMIIKLMRSRGRLTVHESMAAAEQHVMQLVSAQEK
jgi:hypothetical protein